MNLIFLLLLFGSKLCVTPTSSFGRQGNYPKGVKESEKKKGDDWGRWLFFSAHVDRPTTHQREQERERERTLKRENLPLLHRQDRHGTHVLCHHPHVHVPSSWSAQRQRKTEKKACEWKCPTLMRTPNQHPHGKDKEKTKTRTKDVMLFNFVHKALFVWRLWRERRTIYSCILGTGPTHTHWNDDRGFNKNLADVIVYRSSFPSCFFIFFC